MAFFLVSSRSIEVKAVVTFGSFCWANRDTEKISIKYSINHILPERKGSSVEITINYSACNSQGMSSVQFQRMLLLLQSNFIAFKIKVQTN